MIVMRALSPILRHLALAALMLTATNAAFAQETANLWVSTSGGSCTRAVSPVAYNPATACGSLGEAYTAANASTASSLILITGGTYGPQQILGNRVSANLITIQPAAGQTVLFAGKVSLGDFGNKNLGPDYINLNNITMAQVGAGYEAPDNRWGMFVLAGSDYITIDQARAGNVAAFGAQHVMIKNSDLGPCRASTIDKIPGSGPCTINYIDFGDGRQSINITYDNVNIHDYNYAPSAVAAGDVHYRPVYGNGVNGLTISRSTFRNNVFEPWTTISGPDAARTGNQNILIENNEFGANVQTPSGTGGGFGLAWCQNASSGVNGYANVTIRFNSYHAGGATGAPNTVTSSGVCSISNVHIYGNVSRFPTTCQISGPGTGIGTVSWGYNVFVGETNRTCDPTDIYLGGTTSFYKNNTTVPTPGDFVLTGEIMAADNRVPAQVCPATDRLRVARPQDAGYCDAGAHERAGGGDAPAPVAPAAPQNLRVVIESADGTGGSGGTDGTTPAASSDDFNRADASSLGGNWTNQTSALIAVTGNKAAASGGSAFHCAYWNAVTFPSDQFAQIVVRSVTPTARYVFATVRASGSTDAERSHYYISTDGARGAGHLELNKVVNGTIYGIAAFDAAFADGDVLRLEVQGNRLRAYKNGAQLGTEYTDNSLASGQPGMCLFGNAAAADDWTAGGIGGSQD